MLICILRGRSLNRVEGWLCQCKVYALNLRQAGIVPLHHAMEWFHYIMPRNGPIASCHRMVPLELLQQYSFLSPQEEYYLTHQCFLTNRALNLVVWNATEEERGLEGLNIWLQNLHVRGCLMCFSPVCYCHLMYTC